MSAFAKDLSVAQVEKFMKVQFYKDDLPHAPVNWPKNLNIPIALYSFHDDPKRGELEHIGCDLVICAFYMAWCQAIKQDLHEQADRFFFLCRNAIFDFMYFDCPHAAFLASCQLLESNEKMRTFFGLDQTGMVS